MRIVYFIILSTFTFKISKNQGLTNSLNEISDMNNVLGAKNLLKNELVSGTVTGVTYTKNSDGSITCSNTATDLSYKAICEFAFKAGVKYILSGCPSGGSASTHFLQAYGNGLDKKDLGSGSTIQVSSDTTATIRIVYINGQTADETFYPMLRPASIQDDTYVPYSMTNREMTPYVQAISNPNLLDNPWFTVNQRGQSSYTTFGYTFDRWKMHNGVLDIAKNSDGSISISNQGSSNNVQLCQILEKPLLSNMTGTMSIDVINYIGNVRVYYALAISPWTGFLYIPINKTGILSKTANIPDLSSYGEGETKVFIALDAGASITVKAIKLETGSVSTLHMDTTPNYQQELAKCQRYFVRFNPTDSYTAFGAGIYSSNNVFAEVTLPTVLRAKPNVSYSTIRAHSYGRNDVNVSSIIVNNYINNIVSLKCEPGSGANFVNGDYCEIQLDVNNYLDLSCDL